MSIDLICEEQTCTWWEGKCTRCEVTIRRKRSYSGLECADYEEREEEEERELLED